MNSISKEEAWQDFFNGLKVALNNSSIYFPEHPIFIKSAEDLKIKIDSLLNFIKPIKIGFTSISLFADDRKWEKASLYKELAAFFHFRKIKSLEIKNSVTMEELFNFMAKVSSPPRVIFKEGGIENILKQEESSLICLEPLDYSQLLNAQGDEYKDIWVYLLRDVVEKGDSGKVYQFADNFEKVIGKFRSEDLLQNEELQENISRFLDYLKDKEKDKFRKCAKEVARSILRSRNVSQDAGIDKLRLFFKDLSPDDLADTLWQEMVTDDSFNALSFNLFTRLIDQGQHGKIASCLEHKIGKAETPGLKARTRKKIKELFLAPDGQFIPQAYRNTLLTLLKDTALEKESGRVLDRNNLRINYRFLILNLLPAEKNKTRLVLISEKISEVWDSITKEKDTGFIKGFLEIWERKKEEAYFRDVFEPFKKRVFAFLENIVLEEDAPPGFEELIDALSESSLESARYINKIFKENKVDPYILRLFLKFFPEDLPLFYNNLKRRSYDIEFLKNVTGALRKIDSGLSVELLKYIFSFSHILVKIDVLRAMREMSVRDEEFLFSILRKGGIFLKEQACAILLDDGKTAPRALKALLAIASPFGLKNWALENNIEIIAQVNPTTKDFGGGVNALKQASGRLTDLSKKRFFWNAKLRKKAKEALEKLNAGKT